MLPRLYQRCWDRCLTVRRCPREHFPHKFRSSHYLCFCTLLVPKTTACIRLLQIPSPLTTVSVFKPAWCSGASFWSLLQWRKHGKNLLHGLEFAPAWARGVGGWWAEAAKETAKWGGTVKKKKKGNKTTPSNTLFLCITLYLSLLMMFRGCFLWFLFFSLLP